MNLTGWVYPMRSGWTFWRCSASKVTWSTSASAASTSTNSTWTARSGEGSQWSTNTTCVTSGSSGSASGDPASSTLFSAAAQSRWMPSLTCSRASEQSWGFWTWVAARMAPCRATTLRSKRPSGVLMWRVLTWAGHCLAIRRSSWFRSRSRRSRRLIWADVIWYRRMASVSC